MDIPAYTLPTLCLGRSFDLETSRACADVFPSSNGLPIKSMNVNRFSFKYQLVNSSKDINDLLDVSSEFSLKIKANLLEVEGAGQYINESKLEEGTTTLLAVMKCTTVVDTIDGSVKPREDLAKGEFFDTLGTHYVRSITYGVEMVASLKFKSLSKSTKEQIKGNAEGELNVGVVNAGLKASLEKLSAECNDVSDIVIKYYATDIPDKLPTTMEDLVLLIQKFPSRLKNLYDGKGIPISFELQPTRAIISRTEDFSQQRALTDDIDNLESCFDDLRTAKGLAEAYLQNENGIHDDVKDFLSQINQIDKEFIEAISTMNKREGPDKVKACLKTYDGSLDGRNVPGKFVYQWKQILSKKQSVINPGEETSVKVKEEKQKNDVNILILGETGVGKSTWINGIANYFKHESLEDARNERDFKVLIPFRFSFTNEDGKEEDISFGKDDNEVCVTGQSATQFPRTYTFETENERFHLIDTPGIGDSRGTEQDTKNFDNTMGFLTCYDKINAVVVLLKPNNARLTVAFRFCVLELLTHLHKSLVSNIIFAYTNSRSTMYRPGDTLPALKKLLNEHKITMDHSAKSNHFCFDNEAFRFLACLKNGIEFEDDEVDLYSKSWTKSRDTTTKLFERVMKLKPHETAKTLSLNEARNYVLALSKPMGEAVRLINSNLMRLKEKTEELKVFDADIKAFQAQLKFKGFDLEIEQIEYPMTVCAADKCKTYEAVGETRERNVIYSQICHDHCYLTGVSVETMNNEQLRTCRVMVDGKCTECQHDFRSHMHITYKASLVEKEFLCKETQQFIMEKEDKKSRKKAFITTLQMEISELVEEREFILECACLFGVFLNQNALIPYNDSFGDYLDMLIQDEEGKTKDIRDQKKIQAMKKEKETYEEKKRVIETFGNIEGTRKVVPTDIHKKKDQLCSLKHNGKSLKRALDGVMSGRKKVYKEERMLPILMKTKDSKSGMFRAVKSFFKGN